MCKIKKLQLFLNFMFIIFFNYSYSQYYDNKVIVTKIYHRNTASDNELKGKVKSLKEVKYNGVMKFGEITKTDAESIFVISFYNNGNAFEENEYFGSGNLHSKKKFVYDNNSSLIEVNDYNANGSINSTCVYKYNKSNQMIGEWLYEQGKIRFLRNYSYDVNGNLMEFSLVLENNVIKEKMRYKHDKNGNKTEEIFYNPHGVISNKYSKAYTFDAKNNIIEINNYSNGEFSGKKTYKYNLNGKLIEQNVFRDDGSLFKKYGVKYNSNNKGIEYIHYSSNGEINNRYTYKYDSHGNIIEYNKYWSNKFPLPVITEKYVYDKNNNWIRKSIHNRENAYSTYGSESFIIIERSIDYYSN